MKEELTELMHSEFTVDEETNIQLKAGSMWSVAGFDCNRRTLNKWCRAYGITMKQALYWKKYWMDMKNK